MYRVSLFTFVICVQFHIAFSSIITSQPTSKRVCVIGAGIAGLTSARYLKDEGINFTVFEATKYVGGTWRYEPRVGEDEYGMPIHTSMYKNLRTNLPKPVMELRGFPIPEEYPSFPTWKQYYGYLRNYTKRFDLEKHIEFLQVVTSVKRDGNVWKVRHKHVPSGKECEEDFDFVIVGSGHHSTPNMPDVPGEKLFKGTIIHSHDFRVTTPYAGRRVLIMGAGPSGMDISLDIARTAATLFHSHHSIINFRTRFPDNYIRKGDVKEFNETGAVFADGSFEELDDVIYCTGFKYHYPFLDESCGLTLDNRSVVPLYKFTVNIHQPSMVFMGLVVRACIVISIDAQSRYATALVKGNFTLPSKEEMLEEWQARADAIKARGLPMSDIHFLGHEEDNYYASLTSESGISRVPPVMYKIRADVTMATLEDRYTYRNYEYIVLDENTFTRRLVTSSKNENNSSSCIP